MNPIYEPKGRAKEYGDLCVNIYTGCPHRCYYCFAPSVLHRDREEFHSHVEPREGIVDAVKRQLDREQITGKLIHLCFTCDPYPRGYDTTATREVIKAIKTAGNHVQILTKGDGTRDFDLLDGGDWYGITLTGANFSEPGAFSNHLRLYALADAHRSGIKTWVSFEPIVNQGYVFTMLDRHFEIFDRVAFGRLNYHKAQEGDKVNNIPWGEYGMRLERLCQRLGLAYYIKQGLRDDMSAAGYAACGGGGEG